jgi:CubicO group peptidase (beta-lactamase class C family)
VAVDGTRPQSGAEAVRFGLDFAVYVDPKSAGLPFGNGTFYWGGAAGTWFWIDPVNDLAFIGMIQIQGGNRPGGLNFRADSAKLVYASLAQSGMKPSER